MPSFFSTSSTGSDMGSPRGRTCDASELRDVEDRARRAADRARGSARPPSPRSTSCARLCASRRAMPARSKHAGDDARSTRRSRAAGRGDRGRLRRGLEQRRRDRAARARSPTPPSSPPSSCSRRAGTPSARGGARRARRASRGQAARQRDRGLAERFLAVREVVVERALRRAALGDDLLQPRRGVALAAEQAHGGADEALLVHGGLPTTRSLRWIITIGLYDARRAPPRSPMSQRARRSRSRTASPGSRSTTAR